MIINFISLFIIFIIIFSAYIYFENKYNNLIYVKSTIDNRSYLVRNIKDKQEAADMLAKLNQKLLKLVDHLVSINGKDKRVKRLKQKFNPNNISESLENTDYTSYSVNKGEKLVFCIREKNKTQKLEKLNILTFVALHELAHIMTKSIGHKPEFWENFNYILEESVKIGIYKKNNFTKNPKDYCGTKITDSPLDKN